MDNPGIWCTRPNPVPTEFCWEIHKDAPFDAKEFIGYPMVLIINHFLALKDRGELNEYQLGRFRKALLVSHEVDAISKRERFFV